MAATAADAAAADAAAADAIYIFPGKIRTRWWVTCPNSGESVFLHILHSYKII